jgi:hypothetical protein
VPIFKLATPGSTKIPSQKLFYFQQTQYITDTNGVIKLATENTSLKSGIFKTMLHKKFDIQARYTGWLFLEFRAPYTLQNFS